MKNKIKEEFFEEPEFIRGRLFQRKADLKEELKFMKKCEVVGGLTCSNDFWIERIAQIKKEMKG